MKQQNLFITKKGMVNYMKEKFKKILPGYMIVPILVIIVSNMLVYYGARFFNNITHAEMINVSGAIDEMIPVVPAFAIIYVLAFPFWYLTYYFLCKKSKEWSWRVAITDLSAKLICGILFILLPSTNIRPVIEADSGFGWLLELVYRFDSPDNLFPSIHCLESWLCFRFIMGEEKAHKALKAFSFIFAILICSSTLLTKQHALPDVFAGIIIAEAAWQLCMIFSGKKSYIKNIHTVSQSKGVICQ